MKPTRPVLHAAIAALAAAGAGGARGEMALLPSGGQTIWRYRDTAEPPPANWKELSFDDSGWKTGKAPLGYGELELETTLSFGPNLHDKPVTAWFRTTFTVGAEQRKTLDKIGIRLRRDDAAVVYLNGREVIRSNITQGEITPRTKSIGSIDRGDEEKIHAYNLPAALLAEDGHNVIAVEVHQAEPNSSDLFLDLEVTGFRPGEAPARDFYKEAVLALMRSDHAEAADLLARLEPEHPQYARAVAMLGWQTLTEKLGNPAEGLPWVKKAYDKAPDDRTVVRAYIRTHVLSGVLFDKKDIARERAKTVPEEYEFLTVRALSGDKSKKYTKDRLEEDLDYLEHVLAGCFAYLELRPVDYRAALDAIRISLEGETPVNAFETSLAKLIGMFSDGHARMAHHPSQFLPAGYAPFSAHAHQGRVFLVNSAGNGYFDPEFPWLKAIDDKPVEEWLAAAGRMVPKETPQWHRRGALEMLSYIKFLRAEMKLPPGDQIKLTLEPAAGEGPVKETSVKMQASLARRPPFPRGETRRIESTGYLRVPQTPGNARMLASLDGWMGRFRDTRGLIIDLRGNSGATRNILPLLLPYFIKPGDPLRVAEVAAYRLPMALPKPNPAGFILSDVPLLPAGSPEWEPAERKKVAAFVESFTPEWPLPEGKFSEWHVLAFNAKSNPKAYHYDKPLVILHDSGSFSTADVFIGALEDRPATTQIGTATGGGDGWRETYRLPNTGLRFILSQTVNFRPGGKLYEWEGIAPDVEMEARPEDIFGKSDTVLSAAIKRLQSGSTAGGR